MLLGLALVLVLTGVAASSSQGPSSLDWRLTSVATAASFNLWTWEARTLSQRGVATLLHEDHPLPVADVERYFQLTGEAARARRTRDEQWARWSVDRLSSPPTEAEQRVEELERELEQLRPGVEATLSDQIEAELRAEGFRPGSFTVSPLGRFPFVRPELTPGVFFQLGALPDLLVVAPRDRIELIGSVLIQPGLSPQQVEDLENRADGLGVASVVTGIGGLAAYPSMLPDSQSARDLLVTVAHEWTHHYLAFRPLGMAYFANYRMTEINETVADMVGHEIGTTIYDRIYAPLAPAPPRPSASAGSSSPARPDFWTLMRRIRLTVEGYLQRHDVDGATAYMAQQRQELARQGYYVRRLNTAYLSFFGSYAGGANPYEPKLRQLRARSPSVGAFLQTVSQVRQPEDLDRLLAGAAIEP